MLLVHAPVSVSTLSISLPALLVLFYIIPNHGVGSPSLLLIKTIAWLVAWLLGCFRAGELPEICAWGFRNPHRCSFDSATDALYCGDVGQDRVEEVNLVE